MVEKAIAWKEHGNGALNSWRDINLKPFCSVVRKRVWNEGEALKKDWNKDTKKQMDGIAQSANLQVRESAILKQRIRCIGINGMILEQETNIKLKETA